MEGNMTHDLSRRETLSALGALGLGALAAPAFAQIGKQPPSDPVPARQPPVDPSPTSPLPGAPAGSGPLTAAELGWDATRREFVLPPLGYKVEALEPHIDRETMTIHREKHHASYVKGANDALRRLAELREGAGDASLLKHWSRELAFHLSGHLNHCYFWALMAPAGKGGGGAPAPTSELAHTIDQAFGSFDRFASHFKTAAQQVEGGGWAWLVHHRDTDTLLVMQEEKQQNLATAGFLPLLGVDVWEHAYYLKYKWDRKAYIEAFMNVINWPRAIEIYKKARS
jgi:Fe-Mn family superoxide dismutase